MQRLLWYLAVIGIVVLTAAAVYNISKTEEAAPTAGGLQLPLAGEVIVIDPGHGGVDGGASSKSGLLEKDVALDIGFQLRDYLQEAGALVHMTRESDRDLAETDTRRYRQRKLEDLRARKNTINADRVDMFITLHLNAIPSAGVSGAQTFYDPKSDDNKALAHHIQHELVYNLENTTRKAKAIDQIYLLREADPPGVLIETGFLSNAEEARLLEKPSYQNKIAASIYQGMLRYASGESAENE
ncbi:N-acetylmuramoyl-L-alanine amidase [Salsuginibacillus halophilus]|uniref:N-acetylmuramoyl-L-alanine amidase n=1 Tax=Salsuginibacillus halophilus TaxID=517424 RepID=A0A2P8H8V5_9BACI|nr:N-acetylmuramoyl-L-alanine amidase CwlD [Salsuginibacillus halophilus]PSL42599.1 N-acetylmuramoyl-L-alanine amidase [Salsuginibacillus halophilus]